MNSCQNRVADMKINIDRNSNAPVLPPVSGFHYVDQGNYQTFSLSPDLSQLTVYSDSATSCIIVVVVATNEDDTSVTLAHLDSPECITAFFKIISERKASKLEVYAQGANPPKNKTSIANAKQLQKEVKALGNRVAGNWLFLLEGTPLDENRGDFGFQLKGKKATVSNQPYSLELTQRDPTCGGQSVYCIMRRQENPPVELRDAGVPFTHSELVELASIAIAFRKTKNDPSTAFTNIVNMQNQNIRQSWSTTPQYEAEWFSDQLKQGACFALSMAPVVNLSANYLNQQAERPYSRLRRKIIE